MNLAIPLFVAGSLLLGWISRHSLLDTRSHGFYRFLVWECILLLAVHNVPYWFVERFSWYQCLSWAMLFGSLPLLIAGVLLLRRHGERDGSRHDPALLGFEKTSRLVTHGIYRQVRHPLYGSLLLLAWGLYFKYPFWWVGGLAACGATIALWLTAKAEERENLAYFGPDYTTYMTSTRRFLPWLW